MRNSPNVIITGTPGVGKTVHCEQLAQDLELKHLSVNQIAKERDCYETFDEERKSWVVDEDKVRFNLTIATMVCNHNRLPHIFLFLLFLTLDCGVSPAGTDYCGDHNASLEIFRVDLLIAFINLQLLDSIEEEVLQGGYLIDWHACDLFPKSWIDLVVVLRCPSTTIHYDRLASRYLPSPCIHSAPHELNFGPGDTTKRSYRKM